MPLLLSTGATHKHNEPADLLADMTAFDGVELSALAGPELDRCLDRLDRLPAGTHLHAPAYQRVRTDRQLATLLAATGRDVVVHPDTITDPAPWQQLGPRLLLENLDGRTRTAACTTTQISRLLATFSHARLCLDISHAIHVGSARLVDHLLRTHADRIGLLHVGCRSGRRYRTAIDPPELAALQTAATLLPDVPVVLERSIPPDVDARTAITALAHQLHAATSQTHRAAGARCRP